MSAGRSRSWLPALLAGYLLFYGMLYVETAYTLPRMYTHGIASYPAELFRAPWLRPSFALAPLRWLAWGPSQSVPHLSLALLLAAVGLLAFGYLGALRTVQRQPDIWSLRRLLGLALLASLPLALLLPPTSGDYVAYLFMGRMVSVYHVSPWHHMLAEFPAEQCYLSPTAWGASLQCIYGPVWAAVAALTTGIADRLMPGTLTFGSLMLNVLLLRGANALALAAAALAVWRINGRLWPRQQRLVTAAFLLNPLLVYEVIGALHNDIWGVVFLLWTCDLFLRDEGRYVIPLTLSFLTKYIILAIVPFIGIYYWRRGQWQRLAWLAAASILSLGLVEITSLHRLSGYLSPGHQLFLLSAAAFPQFIAMVITLIRGLAALKISLVWACGAALTTLFAPCYLMLVGRTRTREQVMTGSLLALFFYFAGAYIQTVPWYFVWVLGLLCTIRWGDGAACAAWASTFVLLGYVVQFWNHAGLYGWDSWTLVPGFLVAIALPILVCLAAHHRGWRVCPLPAGGEAGSADRQKAIR